MSPTYGFPLRVNEKIPKEYLDSLMSTIQGYLSQKNGFLHIGKELNYEFYFRFGLDTKEMNAYFIKDFGESEYPQFSRYTIGSYMGFATRHFIYVILSGNMHEDVFRVGHELGHAYQYENAIIDSDEDLCGSTFMVCVDEDVDIEEHATQFARNLIASKP